MSTSFNCPACYAGPFRSKRGLQQHLTKSQICALMEHQSCSPPIQLHTSSPKSVPITATKSPEADPGEDCAGSDGVSDGKSKDVVDLLVKIFLDQASGQRKENDMQTDNDLDGDIFPSFNDEDEFPPLPLTFHQAKRPK